jgi:glycosyltransferase involved in cell wall biosynthesis
MSTRPVTIIILTWNGLGYTRRCLDSIRANTRHPQYFVAIVDNGSTDGTVEYLQALTNVTVLYNPANVGFARGNNQAIARVPADHDVVLLNNDTEIPPDQPDWLERLQRTAYCAPDIGIVGCRLRRQSGMLQHAGAYMPLATFWGQQIGSDEVDINQYPFTRDAESVVFACVYIRRAVLDAIGGLSEDYFAYFEDTDYCNAARVAGFRTVCCGEVTIIHHENVSTRENKVSHAEMFKESQATYKKKWGERLAARYEQRLVWLSTVTRPHGYGMTSKDFLLQLDHENVEVTYRYVYGRGTVFPIDESEQTPYYLVNAMKQRPVPRNVPHVVYGQGDVFQANQGPYKIGFTMLEVTGIPAEWARQANLMDEVWVPTEFNRQTFAASGVKRPMQIMPLGVDINYFNPLIRKYPLTDEFKFLTVFEWGERKAPELLLRAFNDTFKATEPVVLVCKANCTDPSVDYAKAIRDLHLSEEGGRIEFVLNKYVPYYQLGTLYRSCDCFVLPSRGEGWGMPMLEAMACGLPVIATHWSAPTAFMHEANSYPLQVRRMIDAVAKCPYYTGFQWADPDEDHLRHLLRHVYEHPDEARAKGVRAAADVAAQWTVTHAAQRIKRRLAEIGTPGRAARRVVAAAATPSVTAAAATTPATVAIDVSRAIGEQLSGVGRYTRSLVNAVAATPVNDLQFLLLPGLGSFVHPEYGTRFTFPMPAAPHLQLYRGALPAFSSPATAVPGLALLHCTGNMVPADAACPLLMTIYDVSFATHPQFHTQENIDLCTRNLTLAIHRGAHFVAISEHSRRDLIAHFHVAPDQVDVVPCTYDPQRFNPRPARACAAVRTRYKLPPRFALFLASLEPRKNLATVLQAVMQRSLSLPVVIAGGKGWLNEALQQDIARAGARVQHIGYVPDEDLPSLYSAATCLVFPSLYEGFGLPVLEAMACGTPAITARNSSLPEVGGDAALYLDDATNAGELAELIERLAGDPQLHAARRKDGLAQASAFLPARIAGQMLTLYRRLLAHP